MFAFWILVTVVTILQLARRPGDLQWWISLTVCIVGLGLYGPIRTAARVRKTIIIRRPIAVVYDFLSRPANLHLWNRRAGLAQPDNIPVAVGQDWTYLPRRPWLRTRLVRHTFSKVEPLRLLEITVDGPSIRTVYSYTLRESQQETELTFDASVYGLPIVAAWFISAYGRFVPSRDLAHLKQVLELTVEAR